MIAETCQYSKIQIQCIFDSHYNLVNASDHVVEMCILCFMTYRESVVDEIEHTLVNKPCLIKSLQMVYSRKQMMGDVAHVIR